MKEFYTKLEKESKDWVEDDIIKQEQREKILKLYEAEGKEYSQAKRNNRVISVLTSLGATLLGVGVLLFVAANWQGMPGILKTIILLGSTFGTYYLAYYLNFVKETYIKTSRALMLLGGLLFGASVFLIAQNYHIDTSNTLLAGIWLIGVLPLAYAFQSSLAMGLSVIIFVLAYIMAFDEFHYLNDDEMVMTICSLGVLMYALGSLHKSFDYTKALGGFLKGAGAFFAMLFVWAFTIDDFSSEISRMDGVGIIFSTQAILTFIIALVSAFMQKRKYAHAESYAILGLIIFLFLMGGAIDLRYSSFFYNSLSYSVLLVLIAGLIYLGFHRKEKYLVNIALFFFALEIVTAYADLFYGLLSSSAFFMLGGILLLGGGVLFEKQRQKLMKKLSNGKNKNT